MSHQSDILMIHPFLFYLFLPFPDNVVQQSLAGIFEKRDDELEVAIVAIIRIGNGGVFTMVGQETGINTKQVRKSAMRTTFFLSASEEAMEVMAR